MIALHGKKTVYGTVSTFVLILGVGVCVFWLVSNIYALVQRKAGDTLRPKQMDSGEFTLLYEGDFIEFDLYDITAEGQKVRLFHTDDKFWTDSKGCSLVQVEQLHFNCGGILVAILFVQKTPTGTQEDGVTTQISARVLNTAP